MSKDQRIEKQCPVCEKTFLAKNYPNRKQVYCSKECWSNRHPKDVKYCKVCNKKFTSWERTKIYCSNECRNIDYRKRQKGSNSHFWQGGKTKYNKLLRTRIEFKEWRESVFKRDNYTCVDCGRRSKVCDHVELHPDHIKPLSEYPELAYVLENGRTLCKECHINTPTYGYKQRWKN